MNSEVLAAATQLLRVLWIAYPCIPLVSLAGSMTAKYMLHRDWSTGACRTAIVLQCISAAVITITALITNQQPWMMYLLDSSISITFLYSPEKLFFLWTLAVPSVLALFKIKDLDCPNMRSVFLFYLGGCSGLVVTGDIFNFFVFYELMIMGAYVLISVKGSYSASVKYMVFGAASSAIFLSGIVMQYASGAGFSYTAFQDAPQVPVYTAGIALLLFASAFFVKGAFFPVSGWVAPCHSAANSLVSAFLASFTIFSSIIGLYYMVLLPAQELSLEIFFSLLRTISLVTIAAGALILFWEPSFKRAVAASTVVSIGITSLMLSHQLYYPAFTYVVLHGCFKSFLFYLYDHLDEKPRGIGISIYSAIFLAVLVVFAAGFFPAPTGLVKHQIYAIGPQWYKWFFTLIGILVIGGFAKFSFYRLREPYIPLPLFSALLLVTAGSAALGVWGLIPFHIPPGVLFEAAAAAASLILARRLFTRMPSLHSIERNTIYRSLNQELLLILLLLMASGAFLYFS